MKRFIFILTTILLLMSMSGVSSALSSDDWNSLYGDSLYYAGGGSSCSTSSADTPTTGVDVDNASAEKVAKQASTGDTNVGYALYNSSGTLLANYNDTFENYGASITKAMLLVAYLNQVGSGTMTSAEQANVTGMIEASNDQDANNVFGYLKNPSSEINAVAQQAGMLGFKYNDQGDSLYYLGQSQITANDFAKFFSKINTMFPVAQKSFALNLLSNIQQQVGLLQAGLPGTVYSKEGWKPEPGTVDDSARSGSPNPFGVEGAPYVVNQAAQFSSDGTTYGLAVTVAGTTNEQSGESLIKNLVSQLIQTNNSASGSTTCSCSGSGSNGSISSLTGSNNAEQAWNYFAAQGLNKAQILGVMANLYQQDSRFDPELWSNTLSDVATPPSSGGWGIIQWTPGNKIIGIQQQFNISGSVDSLLTQLNIVWAMMQKQAPGYQQINNPVDAVNTFFKDIEITGAGGAPDSDISAVEKYDTGGGSSDSESCDSPQVNCSDASAADSSLSEIRQNVICIAKQQAALWGSEPDQYRNQGYYDYSDNVPEEWCADFVSWVFKEAGDPFSGGRDGWDLFSTGDIQSLGEQSGSGFTWHPAGSGYTPVPGDIGVYGGAHVNILVSVSGSTYTFIGGDQDPSYNGNYGGPDSGSTVDSVSGTTNQTGPGPLTGWVSPNN